METVHVNLGARSYDIALGTGVAGVGPFARAVLPKSALALVVSDANTSAYAAGAQAALDAHGFRTAVATVPAGETSKCHEHLCALYDALYALHADRKTAVVAVGGGVIGDLAGFAAASYNRGLPLLMVPTTLLAMVDSSVGGKTGINYAQGKNLIGAFHQPAGVWIDLDALNTLPEREYVSGLAEVAKYGAIYDAAFFEWLEASAAAVRARDPGAVRRIVARSCRLKADVVEADELELGERRAALNYGHTFGHAFEALDHYTGLRHGEAVSIGMTCAVRLAERLNLIGPELVARQTKLLEALGLPTAVPAARTADEVIAVMRRDKKAVAGRLRFVLPTRLGEVKLFDDVPEPLVREVLGSQV